MKVTIADGEKKMIGEFFTTLLAERAAVACSHLSENRDKRITVSSRRHDPFYTPADGQDYIEIENYLSGKF